MNVTKTRAGAFLLILMLLLAACGGGSDKSEPAAPASTDAPAAATAVPPTEPPAGGDEEPASSGEEPAAATEAPPPEPTAAPESEIPYDIPIIEEAVDLEIQETMISYRLEGFEMSAAADFYRNFMGEQGWNILTDSTIGVMGTLVFETDEARVSIKLQSNTFAETVDVTIFVFHK